MLAARGWLVLGLGLGLAGGSAADEPRPVILATTTSVQDTGLLDVVLPMFTRKTGFAVKPIAVGTGQALALAAKGEADVVLVHAPDAEEKFMQEGHGARRRPFAHNDFVIVGPPADPAKVKATRTAVEALAAIASSRSTFVSRGDDSGTHKKEKALWKSAALEPARPWYVESGSGQAQTLQIASQRRAYTLSDRGTFLFLKGKVELAVVGEGDPALLNKYSVIELDAKKHPNINARGGTALADFLLSPDVQKLLSTFGVEKYGQPLFVPDALK
jgi:tungstate transport system substrate-binding protein